MGLLFFGSFHFLHVNLNFSINLVGETIDILKILELIPKYGSRPISNLGSYDSWPHKRQAGLNGEFIINDESY